MYLRPRRAGFFKVLSGRAAATCLRAPRLVLCTQAQREHQNKQGGAQRLPPGGPAGSRHNWPLCITNGRLVSMLTKGGRPYVEKKRSTRIAKNGGRTGRVAGVSMLA